MIRISNRWLGSAAVVLVALAATPALADVRAGVEAWSRGDYAAAVAEWEGPAAAGDADAMFNLAQAYRLGRGVVQDESRAEQLYFNASQRGHVQAADTYGLMLFQNGRHAEALPYVQDSARRGDPRSQYLLGIAHFNGDLVARDWVRAYALLTLANASGLPQAVPAITQMDQQISLADRQQAAGLAETLRAEADSARNAEFAAADLTANAAPAAPAAEVQPRVPRPLATVAVSPSVAAARTAIAEARSATGTDSPAAAGAGYTAPVVVAAAPTAPPPPPPPSPPPVAAPERAAPARAPAPAAHASGPWRVQLGAFSVRANAERLWNSVSGRAELAGHERLLVPSGRVVRLLAGGFASQAAAQTACTALRRGGHDCLVTRD